MRLHQNAVTRRAIWDSRFQEVVDYCRPSADGFTTKQNNGDGYNQIFDATAVDALEEFASGLHSYLTNPSDRWFCFRPLDPRLLNDREVKLWCEDVSNIVYHQYQSSASGHTMAMSEGFLDIGSFGTTVIHQYWKEGLRFKTFALSDCYISENSDRIVDTVIRDVAWTARQTLQEFGKLPPLLAEACLDKPEKPLKIIHLVFPRSDAHFLKNIKPVKNFASIWVCCDTKETLKVDGFKWFPYHCPRWVKMSTEVYGRSPALKAMPDIKMLNRLEYLLIKAVSKSTDPPLIVPSEAFMVPLKTSPGAINYKEPGSEEVQRLEITSFQWPEQKAEQKRDAIRKMFYNDFLRMEKNNVEMTAYEVQDRREEKLRLLSPMLGRQEAELLGPMLTLSYLQAGRHGLLPPPPMSIGAGLKIEYTSPAARAQTGMRAFSMDRYIQRLIPVAQINPGIFDIMNWEAYSRELADAMGTTPKILYSPKEMEARNQEKAQQQQIEQAAATAEPASKSIKNLSDAGVDMSQLMQ
jgi:hypothetical protein